MKGQSNRRDRSRHCGHPHSDKRNYPNRENTAVQSEQMNPHPAPPVPGNTDWERFDNAVGMVLMVPKAAVLADEARRRKAKERKKRAKKPTA